MTIRVTEVNAWTWEGAADELIAALERAGVQKGQILWIDAHCTGRTTSGCHLAAYWDDHFLTNEGTGKIKHYLQNSMWGSWDSFYRCATNFVSKLDPKNVISITASCSREVPPSDDATLPVAQLPKVTVLFVFYYEGPRAKEVQKIHHCDVREKYSWDGAAQGIISELQNQGARAGQVIAIDAHNSSGGGDAIFSAWWNESLPDYGDLFGYLKEDGKNDTESWDDHYKFARTKIQRLNTTQTTKVFSATSSGDQGYVNPYPYAVTYLFYAQDALLDEDGVVLDMKNLKTTTLPKIQKYPPTKHINNDTVNLEMEVKMEETNEDGRTYVFSYEHTVGVTLTPGAEFQFGIPEELGAKLSLSTHISDIQKWNETNTTYHKTTEGEGVTTSLVIPPNTITIMHYNQLRTKFAAPYTMTFKSGRVSCGTWTAMMKSMETEQVNLPLDTTEEEIAIEMNNYNVDNVDNTDESGLGLLPILDTMTGPLAPILLPTTFTEIGKL